MRNTLKTALPLCLMLGLAACAGRPETNQISPVANVGSAVGSNPGQPVSPQVPAVISQGLTNTESQAAPPASTRASRQAMRRRSNPPGEFSGAAGQAPRPTQQQGSGGS